MSMLRRESKYRIVAQQVADVRGSLMDVGARDERLRDYLPAGILYRSTDLSFGEAARWDLEAPIAAPDRAYDVVVALDVLEHVDRIHQAYRELLRVTGQKLFVSLPNMTGLSQRIWFLLTGRLGAKYDLPTAVPSDRHRWLTGHAQMPAFIEPPARAAGFAVERYDLLSGYDRLHQWIARLPLSPALRAETVLFELTRLSAR